MVKEMEPKPDTIKITASQREEILASHADLFVTVRGSSVIGGDQALKKAREVSQLVEELTRFGIQAEDIHLQGVHIETASGALLKSSSAIYRLRVRCNQLEQIGDLIDIFATQKNATLEHIEWKYPDEEAQAHALEAALTKAKAKADKVAGAFGVRLLGVYEFNENQYDEEQPVPFGRANFKMMARSELAEEPSLDMDIQHGKTIQVNVEVWYRISEFKDS